MTANLSPVPAVEDGTVLHGAKLSINAAGSISASTLNEQADEVQKRWLSFRVNWVMVVIHPTGKVTPKDDFTQLLLFQQDGVVCDNVQAVH
ncbi:hypothetical protein P3T76_009265 [Phytophthora citrophthora]|uniref:Uncharacterized protein n=1 Tax=Phytophthora citrophthora TaxID=4793 RepID=A0AAD9GGQ4_9STRA|nr:hypothetical protein P3T76_009265 [Phytophthora citrophthora]